MKPPIGERALTFVFDTNAIWSQKKFKDLVEKAERINQSLLEPQRIRFQVPSLCVGEKLLHLSRCVRDRYDPELFFNGLQELPARTVGILDYSRADAVQFVRIFQADYDDPSQWYALKRDWYLERLTLSAHRLEEKGIALARDVGKRCSLTIDWFIRAHVEAPDHWLVTNDGGPEYKSLERRLTLRDLDQLISTRLDELTLKP